MGFWKIWALLVIALVILGWIRGKHFLAYSTAGFVGLGGLMVLDKASEADQASNSIFMAGLLAAAALATLSLVATHFKKP
jgi:hypothetical protein